MTRAVGVALAGLLVLGSQQVAVGLEADPAQPTADYLVTFAPGTTPAERDGVLEASGAVVQSSVAPLRLYGATLTDAAAQALAGSDLVTSVESDQVREVQLAPNDPGYADQWALGKIGWDAAYDSIVPGGGATVAVLDTGVNPTDDLAGHLVAGTSVLPGTDTADPNGHGTAMASIVAAGVDNGTGIAGVGYHGVSVMPVKVLDQEGLGQDSAIVEGVVYAADHGADVILMSFSNPGASSALQAAVDYAWSKGAVLVAATGNDGSTAPSYPAGAAKVVGVSATNSDDQLWSGSNSGADTFLGAPGVDVASGSGRVTGTSASAAIVAGVAALVRANDPGVANAVVVGRLARTADASGTASDTGNGRVNLARAMADISTEPVVPEGVEGDGGPYVGPYLIAANNDANIAPGWAPTSTTTTFSTLYRKTAGGTVQHVRITLPAGYSNISVAGTAFSSGTWSTPVVNQTNRTIDTQLTGGTGLATDNVDWARIDVTATTPAVNQSGNAAEWLMETFTDTAGTTGKQDDNPPVLIGASTNPSATITFRDTAGNPVGTPVLQNGVPATLRVRITQAGNNIKYIDVAVPPCFSGLSGVTTTSSAGGNGGYAPVVTDGFIQLPSGSIPNNGFVTVQFTFTPSCTSGTYTVSTAPSTNGQNPPSGTNQSVSTTGGALSVVAGLANLSITKTDSPDPATRGGTLTYTLGVSNGGPDAASTVKVVDTLPTLTTFVSATGTNWSCSNASGTVTCDRTGANLPLGAAPDITIVVTTPPGVGTTTLSNSATVSSPNDITPANNTATASTRISNPPSLTAPTLNPTAPTTNTNLQASTTTSDSDLDQVKVDWVWKVTRGANTCAIKTETSPLAAAGSRTVSLDLSTSYPTSSCTGASPPATINPSRGDVVVVEATPTDNPGLVGPVRTNSVSIANSAPVVTLSGTNDLSVDEGTTHTYSYTITDPDGDAITPVNTQCSGTGSMVAGSDTNTSTTGSFRCVFADGPNLSTVAVRVKDSSDALSNIDTQQATVNNVKPSIVLTGPSTADEGETKTYGFTVTDPGQDTQTITWECGFYGAKVVASLAYDPVTGQGSFQCLFADGPATTNVTATVTDSDGASDTDNQVVVVTVSNVAPTVTLAAGNDVSVEEGTNHTYGFTVTDPGADGFSVVSVDCGDDGSQVGLTSTSVGGGSFVCRFPDGPATSIVSVQVKDSDDELSNTDTQTVTVANAAPAVTLANGNDLLVDEGTQHSYAFTVTDPGADTFAVVFVDCGLHGTQVGTTTINVTGGSFDCGFPDGPNDSTVAVQVKDSDNAPSNHDTQIVTISNVAPTVVLSGGASVDEGGQRTYSFSVTDPGDDTFVLDATECGTGGTQIGSDTFNSATGGGSFVCAFPDGLASPVVSVTVKDSDGEADTDTRAVTVSNVAPTVTFSGGNDQSVNEGTTHTFSFTVTDPGADTFSVVSVDCGANGTQIGSSSTTATGGSFDCRFPDGPATSIVSVQVKDSDDAGSNTDTQTVSVLNVAPVVVLSGPNTAVAGDTKTYTFTISDPAGAADPQTYATGYPSCGDSGTVTGTGTIAFDGGSFQCLFGAGLSSTVSVKVNDGNADSNADSIVVGLNRPPSVDAGPSAAGAEGSAIALDGTVSDPGGNTFTVKWTYTAGAGVDAGASCMFLNDAAVDTTIRCTDDGTFSVKLEATDSLGAKSSDTATVTVSNATPVVTAPNETPAPYAKGASVSVMVNFTDAGNNDTHKSPPGGGCSVSWDDATPSSTGTVTEPAGTTPGMCTATHTFSTPGVYTVTFTATDDDAGAGSATVQVVVYDPSVGFVTGGGFLNVGPGSYLANASLSGRANFGFTSQYKKNANVPTGQTEFQFQVGNLNFHSEDYTWLVVSGYKAQYKGTGTINGSGSYAFTLTAYDGKIAGGGGADRFRMRITAANNGNAVIFDNRNGTATDMDVADPQAIAGGSITIHKP